MGWYIYILNGFELVSFITGCFYWKKLRNTYWNWFTVYLGIIFLTEMAGEYLLFVKGELSSNIALYSYFGIPVQFVFFFWLFSKMYKKISVRILSIVSVSVYLICLIIDLAYINKIEFYFESFSYVIGCLFLLLFLLVFFYNLVSSDEIVRFKSNKLFWVSTGALFFYIGTLPFFAFRKKLYVQYEDMFYGYWYLQFFLNYLMYLFFTFSFIWGKPR